MYNEHAHFFHLDEKTNFTACSLVQLVRQLKDLLYSMACMYVVIQISVEGTVHGLFTVVEQYS